MRAIHSVILLSGLCYICSSASESNALSSEGQYVVGCFEGIAASLDMDASGAGVIMDDMAEQLAQTMSPEQLEAYCNDFPMVANMSYLNSVPGSSVNAGNTRRLMFQSDPCIEDDVVFCEPTKPRYPSGDNYDELVSKMSNGLFISLLDGDGTKTTDTDALVRLFMDVETAKIILDVLHELCDLATECADDFTGYEEAPCMVKTVCFFTVKLAQLVVDIFELAIRRAEFHDDEIAATQIQAIFVDREHIIANQAYLNRQIEDTEKSLKKAIELQVSAVTETVQTGFDDATMLVEKELKKMTDLVRMEFDELESTIMEEFNDTQSIINTRAHELSALIEAKVNEAAVGINERFDDLEMLIESKFMKNRQFMISTMNISMTIIEGEFDEIKRMNMKIYELLRKDSNSARPVIKPVVKKSVSKKRETKAPSRSPTSDATEREETKAIPSSKFRFGRGFGGFQ